MSLSPFYPDTRAKDAKVFWFPQGGRRLFFEKDLLT